MDIFIRAIIVVNNNWYWVGPVVLIGVAYLAIREIYFNISEEIQDLFH